MAQYGLLIEYDYCTGCFSCEVACQQEHDHPVGQCGIKVAEFVMQTGRADKPVAIDYVPVPTDLCDLCAVRTAGGGKPSCVKHCQAACMHYGPVEELLKVMEQKPKTVLFRPL